MKWSASLLLPLALGWGGEVARVERIMLARAEAAPPPVTYTVAGAFTEGRASWYGDEFAGRPTASGERFDPEALTAAHRTMRLPGWLEVSAPATGRMLVVRVNDRGPFADDRLIDLSQGAARELGLSGDGEARVRIRPVSLTPSEIVAFEADARVRADLRAAAVKPVAMPEAAPRGRLYVQLGTFRGRQRAAFLAEKSGACVVEVDGLHRVRFGPFADQAVANQALRAAHARGYPEARILID